MRLYVTDDALIGKRIANALSLSKADSCAYANSDTVLYVIRPKLLEIKCGLTAKVSKLSIHDLPVKFEKVNIEFNVTKGGENEIEQIKNYLMAADDVINVTTPCRDRALFVHEFLEHCGCNLPISRVALTNLHDSEIQSALSEAVNQDRYRGELESAKIRRLMDFSFAVNLSIAFTEKYKQFNGANNKIQIGRIQTSVLSTLQRLELSPIRLSSDPLQLDSPPYVFGTLMKMACREEGLGFYEAQEAIEALFYSRCAITYPYDCSLSVNSDQNEVKSEWSEAERVVFNLVNLTGQILQEQTESAKGGPQAQSGGTHLCDLLTSLRCAHEEIKDVGILSRVKYGCGVGRDQTRLQAIRNLVTGGLVEEIGGDYLKLSNYGRSVLDVLPPAVKDIDLSAYFEAALLDIVEGRRIAREVGAECEYMITMLVEEVKGQLGLGRNVCPQCDEPLARRQRRAKQTWFWVCKNNHYMDDQNGIPIMQAADKSIPTEKRCHECGSTMNLRDGRRGRFYSCSGYPECRAIEDYVEGVHQ